MELANIFTVIVALLHLGFLVMEMFLWDSAPVMRAFHMTRDEALATRVLAANQGLYNGFLAAGLLWGLLLGDEGTNIKVFFLTCVLIAGLYGAATANSRILFIQALPAAIALLLMMNV